MSKMAPKKVRKLQEMLNAVVKPRPPLVVDEIFGDETQAALKSLQGIAGLPKSGEIDSATAIVVAKAIKTGKVDKEQPENFYQINGKTVGLTKKEDKRQAEKLKKEILRGPLLEMKIAVAELRTSWDHFTEMNDKQWFVSFCIEQTSGADLPREGSITAAEAALKACEGLVRSGNFQGFYRSYPKFEKVVNSSIVEMATYRSKVLSSSGKWITTLKFTKTGAFTFIGVFAAPVAGAALGTGAVASAMIGGAGVAFVESSSNEVGNAFAGKVGQSFPTAISNVLMDTSVGTLTGFISKGGKGGKHVFDALSSRLAPMIAKEAGFKILSKAGAKRISIYLITEGSKGALAGAIKETAKVANQRQKFSLENFVKDLATNFMKGAALGPLGKVIEKAVSGKIITGQLERALKENTVREVGKQLKGTVHIKKFADDVDARTQKLLEGLWASEAKKLTPMIVEEIFSSWKGAMSPQQLETEITKKMMTPKIQQQLMAKSTKVLADSLKAKAK